MKPGFSELSYAFAYLAELANKVSGNFSIAPSFPSTVMEGKPGFGHDVKLVLKGIPVFFQFKLSHCMKYSSATEFKSGKFKNGEPVYRFYLMALGKSRQTSLMLKLEKRHNLVYYVAPAFHKVSELNQHFLGSTVVKNSRSIRPSRLKKMPDQLEHFVSFRASGPVYRFSSDPELVEGDAEDIAGQLVKTRVEEMDANAVLESLLEILSSTKSRQGLPLDKILAAEQGSAVSAQYLARTYFGCELLFITKKPNDAAASSI